MEVNETTRPLTEVPAENTPETPVSTVENDEKTLYSPKQTQEEVIERLTEINNNACDADKQEIDYLKQTFYKLHKSEQDTARKNLSSKAETLKISLRPPTRWKLNSRKS